MGLEIYRRTVSKAKRSSILAAARKNFLKHGLSHAAMAEIAHDADVSTATLYKHFESKEVLFKEVVQEAYAPLSDDFTIYLDKRTAEEILLDLADQYLTSQFDREVNALLRIVIAEVPGEPVLAREMYEQAVEQRYIRLATVFDKMIEAKLLKPHDTKLSARLIGGMIKELFIWPAMFDQSYRLPADARVKIKTVIDVFLTYYRP